ncbi:MAG: hypothetical protein V7K32_17955 [Nostoc sp.]
MKVGVPILERTQVLNVSLADIEKVLAAASKYGLEIIPSSAESSQV